MRSRWISTIALAFMLVTHSFSASDIVAAEAYSPKLGNVHEDFVLPDIATGKPRRLSDFRGKKVLLIHFASW